MRHPFTLGAVVLALIAFGGLGEANARSRSGYQTYSAELATIRGTMDTHVPAARSRYRDIRDFGLTNSGRQACGAFLILTSVLRGRTAVSIYCTGPGPIGPFFFRR